MILLFDALVVRRKIKDTFEERRKKSAQYLNSLSRDEIFERFAITRVAQIDGLDVIGLPVYSVCRPTGKIVSVNAGKSRDRKAARAGAIAEGIEFSIFERSPERCAIGCTEDLGFPLAEGSQWTPGTPIALELATHFSSGKTLLFPSSLIRIVRPENEPPYFQKSSNGQALGSKFEDAFLQGLYECVERDQVTLRKCSLNYLGVWPPRANSHSDLFKRCQEAGQRLFLFSCTADIELPVYWALLVDPEWRSFGGWGCNIDPWKAHERAILEAIQSRCVYISGARDDMDRRDPDFQRQKNFIQTLDALPIQHVVPYLPRDMSVHDELSAVRDRMGQWKEKIYYKQIPVDPLCAVKVQVLGLEQPMMRHWKPIRWHKLRESFIAAQACTA
jgi:YcaO-like protein with predicted kinase domain